MSHRSSLVLAAAFCVAGTAAAVAQQPAPRNESAQQNVRESEAYTRMVCSNPSFRAKRIAQECGPINDPQLHQNCVASFDCAKPPSAHNWRQAPPSETIR
jgi:hypothetical protein